MLTCNCCGLGEDDVTLPAGVPRVWAVAEFVLVDNGRMIFCRACLARIARNDPAEHNEHVKRWAAKYHGMPEKKGGAA